MFDISWTELLLVGVVAIIVVGPKELPGMLRTLGKTIGTMRRMAGDFQSTFNDAIKEAEKQAGIDEMRRKADAAQNFDPLGDLKKSLSEEERELKKSIEAKPDTSTKSDAPKSEASDDSVNGASSVSVAAPTVQEAPEPVLSTDSVEGSNSSKKTHKSAGGEAHE
ncbi:Sec-independent protein translocase protein TatB [Pseudovibrio sp. SPO723]|uniref:Sec-independent protein translocase protein TatB n=1 Tax=Nesiotobacter zosterae TaxID=392721 RepID=UPI0029C43C66|nr:Sec-independent protein translocase protein TatB [Pseudovibrio sp. SPO723]MDX5592818.1 Sec-independent protein translocase protein TatB [Pseudovibrio sp. SPO723]